MRISDYLERASSLYPRAEAIVDSGTRIEFGDLSERVARIATGLRTDAKLGPGARVAVLSPNHYGAFQAILAISRAELVWLPINYRNALETHREQMTFFEADALIFHSQFEADARQLLHDVPSLRELICLDSDTNATCSFENWANAKSAKETSIDDPADLSLLIPTGGTTGPSKGVMHTHQSLEICLANLIASIDIPVASRHLIIAPMTHAAGFFALAHLVQGGTNVILPEFDPEKVLDSIESERITHLFLPPTALYALLAHKNIESRDFSSLVSFAIGAAPVAPEKFKEAVRVFGPVMMEVYGQSESFFPMLIKKPSDYLPDLNGEFDEEAVRSAGRPALLCRVEIMDKDGNLLPPNEAGEIVVRTSSLMSGYYNAPEETAEVSTHGWHHTTDIGIKDARGFFTVIDRIKDMIVSGGFNIYPVEIENVLNSHSAVLDCAVIGVPDDKWGEAVKAVVEIKPGASATTDELLALCRERLGGVKTPKSIDFIESLPRSAVGKVLKRELRDAYWKDSWRSV